MSLKDHHHFHHQNDDDGPHIYHGIDLTKVNLSSLPKSQQEHLLMHEKHRGHEKMHAVMLLILILSMFLAQILLIWWRKKSFKSYQNVSMFGMWIIPFCVSLYHHYWRFISIWLFVTIVTMILLYKPLFYKTLDQSGSSIPRQIYRWFFYVYSISSVIAVTGYVILMLTLLGVNVLLGIKPIYTLDVGIILLFYGIYYGVLTRDFTDFLVDILAANIGYYSPSSSLPSKQLNSRTCAICGRPHRGPSSKNSISSSLNHYRHHSDGSMANLIDNNHESDDHSNGSIGANAEQNASIQSSLMEKTYTLTCGHTYHQYCIFGWCLVGKKQLCPFCREKVDLNKLFSSLPFQKPHYLYGNLLDFIRYLIAWQPVILFATQIVNYIFGLE
ncbi:RING finger protein 121-like protein [Sarcoptes scabiei]|uniref:RING finger protein 121-like protein n=1 Tax=Sarcoptes scabiei TaxID=52283 RepID=A0A132ACU4_SARSC|nr:RING finger protein 121-like protein [Sarcoptes scabiei]